MSAQQITLEDKYEQPSGLVYLNGLQTLVRALLEQQRRDRRQGLNTAGFVSGYRGSPLGTLDKELWRADRHLARAHIKFVPGVNEELAANAVGGTQQLALFPGARYDGVFALWYAKGPGVDRAGDVLRHANLAGTAPKGGVLLVCGDDHGGVSTTTNHQSDLTLRALSIPMLLPGTLQEVLELSLHGWALSRYTGLYVGLKALADTIEVSASVDVTPRSAVSLPAEFQLPPGGLGLRWPDNRWSQEQRLQEFKLPAFKAYVRANDLNPVMFDSPQARLGVIASGKAYYDLMQALADLDIDPRDFRALGLRICKVMAPWPLDHASMREFAAGLEEIAVIEEKEPLVESQLYECLYALPERERPCIVGKISTADASERLPIMRDLNSTSVACFLGAWLLRFHDLPAVRARLRHWREKESAVRQASAPVARAAYYCSGCPHSTSTKVPEGSYALAGVGCHYLATSIYPEQTRTFSVMGTEGSNWIGIEPFSSLSHSFVNIGEGTYFHSGILAIRAAVAAGSNVTYRVLYNDAVAMTGGQRPDGPLTVAALVAQLEAEGVTKVMIVAEQTELSRADLGLPEHHPIHPRSALDTVQNVLRGTRGCTALVYVQTCAAEKRRRRKAGKFPDPSRRVFINTEVCEGCGDCGKQSNCVSVLPAPTELGVKRAIDQSNCNKDYSCLDGFCPSFVTVVGGRLRVPAAVSVAQPLPEPIRMETLERPHNILVTGIGGTGVITVGALLGMAAHIEGKAVTVLDMTGMAQKNGGVQSHIRIAQQADSLGCARIQNGGADLLLASDMLEATSVAALEKLSSESTRMIANTDLAMPGGYAQQPERMTIEASALRKMLLRHVDERNALFIEATSLATALIGNAIAANLFVLGMAYQAGYLPVAAASILRAIELNGVAVQENRNAFAWGRNAQFDLQATRDQAAANSAQPAIGNAPPGRTLEKASHSR